MEIFTRSYENLIDALSVPKIKTFPLFACEIINKHVYSALKFKIYLTEN